MIFNQIQGYSLFGQRICLQGVLWVKSLLLSLLLSSLVWAQTSQPTDTIKVEELTKTTPSLTILKQAQESQQDLPVTKDNQAALLDALLGHLDYVEGGTFEVNPDMGMQGELAEVAQAFSLSTEDRSAYIVRLKDDQVVWKIEPTAPVFNTVKADNDYALQWIKMCPSSMIPPTKVSKVQFYQLAVQNFWIRNQAQEREEYRIVVALPHVKEG
ncbi:MAG: hypothetical protein ACRCR4_07045 [Thiotrichaceae bacterium]|uniref:Uncharacterized protein n=1 Tax=Candidatus Thiocaldithrix dubininis TaxID=3080823 RepID=A0AA95KJI2_9GAMM|nr:MAG: hypothetical protein QJT80_10720 [Candidatus Thiocaldithrix dubininis]